MLMNAAVGKPRFVAPWIESLQRGRSAVRWGTWLAGLSIVLVGCRGEGTACERCDVLVVAATGEPSTLVPPLILETVGRDISDYIYERLANLKPGAPPGDSAAFEPGLAAAWARVDSLTWRFTLRSGAAWHNGAPVTSDDVVFSFAAYADTALGSPGGAALAGVSATADGPRQVLVRFPRPSADQLLDATYQVRVLPRALWDSIPRSRWGADSSLATLVGSGPFRLAEWRRGQSLRLERIDPVPGAIRQIVWRFAGDQDAALNLVLAGEADLLETATSPDARARASRDTTVVLRPYPSAVFGFLGFRHADPAGRPHPILAERAVRRALALAIDRQRLVSAVLGPEAAIPTGPMSRALWLWSDGDPRDSLDAAGANHLLDSLGWLRRPDGIRAHRGRRLAVDILVPSTSGVRRQLAEGIQQMWRIIGVDATITAVDFAIFQARLRQGRFDAMIAASLDEPSPRGIAEQWSRAGWVGPNQIRYFNAEFESQAATALAAPTPAEARRLWGVALATLRDDAPAVFLYSPTNVAVVTKRFATLPIDPFSWLSRVGAWRP